jgi:hypothetical protein
VAPKADLFPVRGPVRQAVATRVVGKVGLTATVGVHDIDLLVGIRDGLIDDAGTVRRPLGLVFDRRAVSEPGQPAPIRVHHEEIDIAELDLLVEYKEDLLPIRRPVRVLVETRVIREPGHPASVRVHGIEIGPVNPVAAIDNTEASQRDGGYSWGLGEERRGRTFGSRGRLGKRGRVYKSIRCRGSRCGYRGRCGGLRWHCTQITG